MQLQGLAQLEVRPFPLSELACICLDDILSTDSQCNTSRDTNRSPLRACAAKVKRALGVKGLVSTDGIVSSASEVWNALVRSKEVLEQLPVIGLLRVDRGSDPVPPFMLDNVISNTTNSQMFRVQPVTVEGLSYDTVRAGCKLSDDQLAAMERAVMALETAGAIAIVGDTGMLVHYQTLCAEMASVPVMLSPLLQAPLLVSVLQPESSILVVTSDARTFTQADLRSLLLEDGRVLEDEASASRFVLRGMESAVGVADPHTPIPLEQTQNELLALVRKVQEELALNGTPLGAVIFESALLPPFSDVVRHELSLLVADNMTLADFALKACTKK